TAVSQIEGKKMKGIAAVFRSRTSILPDLGTAHEEGLADFDAYILDGIFLPKDTPPAVARKLPDATLPRLQKPGGTGRENERGRGGQGWGPSAGRRAICGNSSRMRSRNGRRRSRRAASRWTESLKIFDMPGG